MFRNVYYLVLGVVLGALLGFFVCDETKKRITKAIQRRAKRLSRSIRSSTQNQGRANTSENSINNLA